MKNYLLLFLTIILFGSCAKSMLSTKTSYPEEFQKEWKHSYEESAGNVEIYRPADYKTFTPSKFRQVYKLKADGRCEYLVLHPADAHYMAPGTWNYRPDIRQLRILNSNGEQLVLFEVLEISNDLLKLQIVR